MFKDGEKVVYPAHGGGEMEAVRIQVVSGTERKFYMLRILDTDMKIMVPVDNAMAVGLRKIIDKTTVTRVYRILREKKKPPMDQQTWNRRYREYTEKIKTGSVTEIAAGIATAPAPPRRQTTTSITPAKTMRSAASGGRREGRGGRVIRRVRGFCRSPVRFGFRGSRPETAEGRAWRRNDSPRAESGRRPSGA